MKSKYLLYILAGICVAQAACKRTLEAEPQDRLTEDLVFDQMDRNADNAKSFLYGIYSQLPIGFNRLQYAFLDNTTDDGMASQDADKTEDFRKGRISPLNVTDNPWFLNYGAIRRANMFLSKIDKVPATAELKRAWKAEARFLRSLFYFELMKRWGGVPLMGDTILKITDNLNFSRSTLEQTKDYILSEIASYKDSLLPANTNDADVGRANKGAALALKARVLLYWASPLYNPTNITQRWTDAANAAQDVTNLGIYSLHADYTAVFITGKTTEMIFARIFTPNQLMELNNGPVGYLNAAAGKGLTSPSQELVDAFPMDNGLPITDGLSGYVASKPYEKRDPRFEATILYNGKKWLNRDVQTFEGGLDKPGGIITQTKTGYYLRKFMGKFETGTAYSNTTRSTLLFRYAEVLLNFAEAKNEESGPVKPVYDALVALRKRAGIKAGTGAYGLPAGLSKESMRTLIQNERRIELAFEEHRHWDIRRWKLAGQVMNAPLSGMKIVKNTDGSFTYTKFIATTSEFDINRMYWYPIPYSEIQTNPNMKQNIGWEY